MYEILKILKVSNILKEKQKMVKKRDFRVEFIINYKTNPVIWKVYWDVGLW